MAQISAAITIAEPVFRFIFNTIIPYIKNNPDQVKSILDNTYTLSKRIPLDTIFKKLSNIPIIKIPFIKNPLGYMSRISKRASKYIKKENMYFLIDVIAKLNSPLSNFQNSVSTELETKRDEFSKIDPVFIDDVLQELVRNNYTDLATKLYNYYFQKDSIQSGGNRNTFKVSNPMYILATNRKHMYLI